MTKRSVTHKRWRWLLVAMVLLLSLAYLTDTPARLTCAIAESALNNNQPHAAMRWITRARAMSTDHRTSLLLAVRVYLQLNKTLAAAQILDQASQLSIPEPTLQAYRAIVAAQGGTPQAIDDLLVNSAGVSLPNEAYEAIVRGCYLQGNFKRASLVLDELDRSHTAPATIAYLRGRQLEIQEDFPQACQHYLTSQKLASQSARAAFRAGRCLHQQRQFAQALEQFKRLNSGDYQTIGAVERADCLWELGEIQSAASAIESALAADPKVMQSLYLELDEYVDSDRAAMTAARIEDARENSEQCARLLERVLAFNHRDFEARALLIKHLRVLKRDAQADELAAVQNQMVLNRQRCRDIRQQLDSDPSNTSLRCTLAELYWQTESEAEARLLLEETLQLQPDCTQARDLLAKIKAESQRPAR